MKIIKSFIILTAVLGLLFLLPWAYDFVFAKPFESPLVIYSPVKQEFMRFEFQEENIGGWDMEGNAYDWDEFYSLMPTVYFYDLYKSGNLPDSLNGRPFDRKAVKESNFTFRSFPKYVNRPDDGLYKLYDLKDVENRMFNTDDLFRMTDEGIEFVNMERNRIDEEKSRKFTTALSEAGFQFPKQFLNRYDDSHKSYDNGYLIVDHAGELFQLQCSDGEPLVHRIALPEGVSMTHAFVTEYHDRRLLGFARSAEGVLYAIENKDLSLRPVPMESAFDPRERNLVISGEMFNWNIIEEYADCEYVTAIDAETFEVVKTHVSEFAEPKWKKIGRILFPVRLEFTSPAEQYVRMRLR